MLSERSSNIESSQAFPAQVANKCIPGPGSIFSFIALRTTFHVWPRPHFKRSYRPKLTQQSLKWKSLKFFLKPDFRSPFLRSCNQLCCQSVWNLDISYIILYDDKTMTIRCILRISCHESALINDHSNDEDHEESEQMTNGRHLPKKFFFFGCASGAREFMMRVGEKWYNLQF